MKALSKRTKNICSVVPYTETPILSIQEAKQKSGWSITALNLPEEWKYTQGEGVTIAVIDSGCDLTHEDLKHNLIEGKNFINSREKPIDRTNHGSHVCGIICAENNDLGVVGVAPKAKVMPLKALDDDGNGAIEPIASAIKYAADQKVDFIVMSLGCPRPIPPIHTAIKYAAQKGIVCFVAAGNAGLTPEIFYPAAYPETIAIGAIDKNFRRAQFSCTGKNLDFMCPGVDILSTIPNNWYALMSGSSMAAPFACGVAALLLSYSRSHNNKIKLTCMNDYREIFRQCSIPLKNGAINAFMHGLGMVDPRKLMEYLKTI